MNDLVFVMYNCKLNERQTKNYLGPSLKLDDLSSDDEWITPKEDLVDSSSNEWLSVLDGSSNANDDVIDLDVPLDEDEVQVMQDEDEDGEDDVGVLGGEVDEVMSVDSDEGGNPIDNDNSDYDVGNGDDDGESYGDEEDNCDVYEEGTNFGLD
ncbi:Zf-BED domain-containing protein [Quillaja saponaria]|uniref:Zf-BED domain-containing protein n=1 Tax=Quillaja saponaria TaxID=32244 RepID=A0AAD7M498_QUISA|nr:Zf-BED domain-containing protein [Quillaja saponaria]